MMLPTPYRTPAAHQLATFRVTRWAKLALIYRQGCLGGVAGDFTNIPARPWLARWLRVLLGLPWPTRRTPTSYRKGTPTRYRNPV